MAEDSKQKPPPVLAPDEIQPSPRDTANVVGGLDPAEIGPEAANPPGRSSDHEAEDWRADGPSTP